MIRRFSVSLLAAFALLCAVSIVSQAESQPLMTRHTRPAVVNGEAQSLGRLPANQTMHFDIVLALRHQPELDNFLKDLYDPSSSNYRHFVTPSEFTARFGPSQEDYDALIQFAQTHGFTVVGGSRDARDVQLKGTVGDVENAFHVKMGLYQHPTENRTFYAPDREPTVDLPFQLWHVTGLDNYSIPRPLFVHRDAKVHSNATTGSCPEESFCGSDMRAAYYEGTALTGTGQNIGLLEYAGTDLVDLSTYYKNAKQTEPYTPTLVSVDGFTTTCTEPSCDDTEQTLDMTQSMGMAPGTTMLYMFVCGNAYGTGDFSDTACLSAMSTATPLPLNLSSSWTWSPADPSSDDPYFEQMATQGQSFFQAAGDSGVYRGNAPWPSNSAYVMSVGGTDLTTTGPGGDWASETVWEYGGGGYGTNVTIPSWQVTAADDCATAGGGCSKTDRDVPDVAANANFTFYVCADQEACTANEYGGTSFAAPMWAGYLALANQQAAANGDAAPGFINPTIYPLSVGNSDADFHDITSDANGSNGAVCVTGYNMCGGWGSPNGDLLINALAPTSSGGPAVSLSPTSLKWGKVDVGTTTAAKKVVLTNTGTATLNITTIAPSGDFALATVKATKKVTPCVNGGTVAAGATCEIKVTFTPTQTGTLTGDITFTDNAANSPQQVALSGTGKAAE